MLVTGGYGQVTAMDSRSRLRRARPQGCLRAALRLPLWLYRLRLGWLLGRRFLMLAHTGRRTGRTYRTVLEVVRYDARAGTYVVVSAWGEQADWYRNVRWTPQVTLRVAGRHLYARAVVLPPSVALREVRSYARRHPVAYRMLTQLLLAAPLVPGDQATGRQLIGMLPVVAFVPRER